MITAVVSLKGGVGKTTTAVHLAAALAETGRHVLLVDLDPNGSASLSVGVGPGQLPLSIADVLLRSTPIVDAIFPTSVEGLDLVTTSADLRQIDRELLTLRRRRHMLREALAAVEDRYDHVFLDCAPQLNDLMKGALVASDGYIIPTTPHFLALDGIDDLVASAERVTWQAGSPSRFLGVVLTAVDYRIRSTRTRVAKIRRRFGRQAFAVEIRTNVSLAEAPAEGRTVFQYAPHATGAKAYRLLADELLGLLPRPAVSRAS